MYLELLFGCPYVSISIRLEVVWLQGNWIILAVSLPPIRSACYYHTKQPRKYSSSVKRRLGSLADLHIQCFILYPMSFFHFSNSAHLFHFFCRCSHHSSHPLIINQCNTLMSGSYTISYVSSLQNTLSHYHYFHCCYRNYGPPLVMDMSEDRKGNRHKCLCLSSYLSLSLSLQRKD